MPVGRDLHYQRLVKVVRRAEDDFEKSWLGDVRFVPLVGEDGWPVPDSESRSEDGGSCRGRPGAIERATGIGG
jgi:protein-L-isoaspartate(D-aspartate) O-methyltransferase